MIGIYRQGKQFFESDELDRPNFSATSAENLPIRANQVTSTIIGQRTDGKFPLSNENAFALDIQDSRVDNSAYPVFHVGSILERERFFLIPS